MCHFCLKQGGIEQLLKKSRRLISTLWEPAELAGEITGSGDERMSLTMKGLKPLGLERAIRRITEQVPPQSSCMST